MSGNKTWPAAAIAAGFVALAALIGCGGEESVASKSAAAFEEAKKEGKLEGSGHGHGHDHGAPAPGGGHQGHEMPDAAPGESAGHQHGTAHGEDHGMEGGSADHSAMGHGAEQHAGGHASPHDTGQHAGHGAPAGSQPAAGHDDHAGHSQPAAPGHDHGAPKPAAPGHDHAGHSAPGGETPSRIAAELPAQPAGILRPDPLDAPAATSVLDAQRSAEMSQGMSGGHGGHGAGTYRHVDAGREPEAHEEPEPQHHDHGAAEPEASLYVCPMHPEVTSKTPGTCPKCGMTLVERREE